MNHAKKILWSVAAVLTTAALLIGGQLTEGEEPPQVSPTIPGAPVLVELFTSQGCSSCPPADRLLSRLGSSDEFGEAVVIPLSYHVDYWNYIGWTDPFSSSEWSLRQSSYADSFDSRRVYTPQLVINGRRDCVGSDEKRVREEIARAAGESTAGRLQLELNAGDDPRVLHLDIDAMIDAIAKETAGDRWSVMVAVFENGLETPVSRGENSGRKLRNSHVVRSLQQAFTLPARPGAKHSGQVHIELAEDWDREHLGVAVFLQDPVSRHIHGAAMRRL